MVYTFSMKNKETSHYTILAGFLGFLILPVLYILKVYDTNTLTNWQWLFTKENYMYLLLTGIVSILMAFLLSRLTVVENYKKAFLFIVANLAILPFWEIPEVIIDAGRYFTEAKYMELRGIEYFITQWGKDIHTWTDLPTMPFIYGLVFRYIGEERVLIQIINTLMFSSTVVVTFLIGKELWDDERSFYGGFFLLSVPYLYTQVPLMLVDIGAMFFFTATVYIIIKVLKGKGMSLVILAWASLILTIFTKYSLWPMLLMAVLCLFLAIKDVSVKRWIILLIPPLIFVIFVFILKSDVFVEQIRLLRAYQWEGLKRWQEGVLSSFFFQSHPFMIILSLWGGYLAIKKRDPLAVILLWPYVFIFLFNAKRLRYMIPLIPFISLLAGYALKEIMDKKNRRFVVSISMVTAIMLGVLFYKPFLIEISLVNLKDAAMVIDRIPFKKVLVYPLEQEESSGDTRAVIPILDIYTEKTLICVNNNNNKEREVNTYRSPLQFTWSIGCPDFYRSSYGAWDFENLPRLYISSSILSDTFVFSEGYLVKRFTISTGRFRFKTLVTLLIPQ